MLGGGEVTLNPRNLIAVGLNYREHVAESLNYNVDELGIPARPILFNKLPGVLLAPGEAIILPRLPQEEGWEQPRTDYEAELACVLTSGGKNLTEEEAFLSIGYYTCFNDVSQRDIQKNDASGWFRGKSFDTFGPVGPVLVPRETLGKAGNLRIQAQLNGKLVQDASTSQMIFSPTQLISYISRNFTLYPGDIIITGTPGGIGPLHEGDTIEIIIEGIGTLTNTVQDELF